jgi:FkbM family methyltransferase
MTYYGQEGLDKIIEQRFLKDKKNGFFVECGAFDGELGNTSRYFEENMGWTGVYIEPMPLSFEKLKINRPNSLNLNWALSDKEEEVTFTQPIFPTFGVHNNNGSIKHCDYHKAILANEHCTFTTFKVKTRRFENIAKEHNFPEIDLFVLDVEGYELEALRGIITMEHEKLPKIFCIEHTLCGGVAALNALLGKLYTFHSTYLQDSFYLKNEKK